MQLERQDVAFSAARVRAGVEPMCRKERGTFVSPARAIPQASAPFRSIFSFREEMKFITL